MKKTIKIKTSLLLITISFVTTFISCKKDDPASDNAVYIMAYSTYGLDRLQNCGFFNNSCVKTSSYAEYNEKLDINQMKGKATVTSIGSDSVKISYTWNYSNVTQKALDTLYGTGYFISKDSGTIYRPNAAIVKEVFSKNSITGFTTEANIPFGDYPVINNTGSKLNPTNHTQIHNIFMHRNGGGRVEFVFNKK